MASELSKLVEQFRMQATVSRAQAAVPEPGKPFKILVCRATEDILEDCARAVEAALAADAEGAGCGRNEEGES